MLDYNCSNLLEICMLDILKDVEIRKIAIYLKYNLKVFLVTSS